MLRDYRFAATLQNAFTDHFLTFAAAASHMDFIAGFRKTGGGGLVPEVMSMSRSLRAAQA
ncbi:MAG: hypothetical protein ABGZ23_13120 [Fuerstiella sp.]|nr:hypothetical protein [Fuerstiella sp.]